MNLTWQKSSLHTCVTECGLAWAEAFRADGGYRASASVRFMLPTGRYETLTVSSYALYTVPEAKQAAEQLLRDMVAAMEEQIKKIKEQLS